MCVCVCVCVCVSIMFPGPHRPCFCVCFQGQVISCWDKGFAVMKFGEKAMFKCDPPYAYGEKGSPPSIPPNATLQFDVELLDTTKKELWVVRIEGGCALWSFVMLPYRNLNVVVVLSTCSGIRGRLYWLKNMCVCFVHRMNETVHGWTLHDILYMNVSCTIYL